MSRLNYLDNLKVALTFLVIFHHAGQAYGDGGEWGYTPSNPEEVMPWIWHFFSTNAAFFMGLYFFISGYFIPGSYDRQGFGTFVKNILVLRNAFEKTRKQMKANTLSINALSDNLNFPMFAELTLKKT